MTSQAAEGPFQKSRSGLLARLARMVEQGQVTQAEAERFRTAPDAAAFEAAELAVRLRHAGTRLSAAVAGGTMSQAEADATLERLRQGEHPQGLRSHLRKLGAH